MTDAAPRLTPRWRDLFELRPYDRDHWAALRVGLATAIPLIVLWATGRTDLAVYAVFGAFTSVYGRNFPHVSRLRLQLIAGAAQLLSIAVGGAIALSPNRNSIVVIVAALWVFGASLLADRVRWTPPGPIFQVFGLAGVAYVPATPSTYGAGLIAAVGAIAVALLIGYVGRLIWRAREGRLRNPYTKPIVVPPPAEGYLQHATMFLVGAGLAGAIPALISIGHPYWAIVSVIAALSAAGGYNRVLRAVHRFAGTLLGLALGALILAFHPTGLVTIVIIVVLQALVELVVVRNYSLALIVMTPLVLAMGELGHPQPLGALIWQRGVETFIGAVVAVGVAVVLELFIDRKQSNGGRADSIRS
ncbi:FUSC family protein [Gryllotalpicola protaetiae]|uniref:FUSC family protein n=1 Tax=Gryllotalpicola protaetiae TaxID=2419771 RepID=A0A387BRT5_9MICO|nr:FUSC family protein [Gryllotalpicola protaetiae]AYG03696.1 FUSC family protein [Gryllotalpicola protaetiae]